MKHIATCNFVDLDSGQEALAIVRADKGQVGFCLSLKEDGDILIVLPTTECERLLEALHQAVAIAKAGTAG